MTEQYIQTKIKNKLEKEGWFILKLIKVSKSGIPDILALRNGITMFIEVKKPNGKLSELQRHRIKELRDLGFEVKIWTDYNKNFEL
jgi:Holliday junction resolvase